MIQRYAALICLVSESLYADAPAPHFEPAGANYMAIFSGRRIEVSVDRVRIGDEGHSLELEWEGTRGGASAGEDATGGVTNYFASADEARWRTAVPHYSQVRVHNLYRNTDIAYYFRDYRFEFDIHMRPGSDSRDLRFGMKGAWNVDLDNEGDLIVDGYRLKRPAAYQVIDGTRRLVECRYAVNGRRRIGFQMGKYDHRYELIVDPVVEFLTYFGGSGFDHIQAIGADSAGNVVVAGVTSSPNFPGSATPAGTFSIFVSKLNPTGSSVLFTTILGSRPATGTQAAFEYVPSLAVDSDGSIYVTGQTISQNFPTTSGAWQRNASGGFLTRLNNDGTIAYSTFLGPPAWGLLATRVRALNGIAYLAGNVSAAEFFGTSGALQRSVAGKQDFFALAMVPDGSGPLFSTAFGGSGQESISDMTLDANGNIVIVGASTSADFPVTADALPYPASSGAVMVRIDPTGSHLVSSTWLGAPSANVVGAVPDGGIVVGGSSAPPAGLPGNPVQNTITASASTAPAYLMKFGAGTNRVVWTTELFGAGGFFGTLSADAQGNIYWQGYPNAASGGALGLSGAGIVKLSADGSLLLYASGIPGVTSGAVAMASAQGSVYIGGYTASGQLPVTPGVLQPAPSPGLGVPAQNPDDGFVGVLDLSSFTTGNFFVVPPQFAPASLTWRIGEPAPKPLIQAIQLSGDAGQLTATASSRLTASYSTSPSPAVTINVDTSQSAPGAYHESVTMQSQANSNAVLALPVALTVQPQVSFDLATYSITIRYRQGQQRTAATVSVTPNFGNEYFSFTVVSSASWLYGSVNQFDPKNPVLSITTTDQPPGTYDGALTVGLQNLQNANRVVQVHYIVDPPATIQVSTTTMILHVVKGRPVTSAVDTVTGSVPGVKWGIFVGTSRTWLQVTQTTTATPGEIQVTVDPASVEVGIWAFSVFVSGENNQSITVAILIDVSSGAPLDVVPNSITYQYIRGGSYLYQPQLLSFITPTLATAVQWKADQPWITPTAGQLGAPGGIYVNLDTALAEGVYQGKIAVTAGSNNVIVPVTWKIYDFPHLVFPQNPINFQWRIGDPLPAPQQISITSPTLLTDYYQAVPTDFPTFLKVDPEYGPTPATVTLTAVPSGLEPGSYKTNLSVSAQYPYNAAFPPIPVTFTVLPDPNAPKLAVSRVTDAASYLGGALAPGEAVVLFGSGLGPATLAQAQPGANGYPTSLAGWTVYFDEFPAPVLYVSDKQTAVMVPFGVSGRATSNVTATAGGAPSTQVPVTIASTNPSIFTANASGSGIAAALNITADGSLSPHTVATPAAPGGIVAIYATGLGVTTPAMPDGSLAGTPLPQLNASVRVLVAGVDAQVLYAGPAPGEIAGLTQINLRIPATATGGLTPVLILAGDNASQPGVTLAIQ
jgi:uncharacterized protein (TIGR03437 family)